MNNAKCHRRGLPGLCAALVLLLMLAAAHRANAESVYKCRNVRGDVAYQDHACANAQQETQIEIAKAPSPADSPEYGVASHARPVSKADAMHASSRHGRGRGNEHEVMSYECRASNGDVFYRHSGCPKSIKAQNVARAGGRRKQQGSTSVSVSAVTLSRSEACRRLAAGGSIGRAGHEHDEQVSTYDRNAGRDPCRRS